MPMLFYLPMIIWMGMCGIAHEQMRVPVKAKVQK